ncbi:hypothetical protein BGZ67_008874 [Mortierella alpina]|nr:hypothetical protein BGZ67_008874 [Mortierella alpina]
MVSRNARRTPWATATTAATALASLCILTLPAHVLAAPPPSLTMASSCAGTNGSWIVGLASDNIITFVKHGQPPAEPTVYSTRESKKGFNGGKCFESSPNIVHYVAETFLGSLTVNASNSTFMEWADLTKVPAEITRGVMNPNMTALGKPASGTAPVILTAISGNLIRWEVTAPTAIVLASFAQLRIDPSKILGMALSGGATPYLWMQLQNTGNSMDLFKFDVSANPTAVFAAQRIHTTLTLPQVLVPWNNGDDGVAFIGSGAQQGSQSSINVTYFPPNGPSTTKTLLSSSTVNLAQDQFVAGTSTVTQISPSGAGAHVFEEAAPPLGNPGDQPPSVPGPEPEPRKRNIPIAAIIGSIVGVVVLAFVILFFLKGRQKKKNRGRSIFAKKQKDLFPAKAGDESMVPLGLYHQDRSLPQLPRHLENDLERLGHGARPGDTLAQSKHIGHSGSHFPTHSRNSSHTNIDETIPLEAALAHHRHDHHTPQGLSHSISVRSTTSNFARQNTKTGKRVEEKIQLQVIRYEVQDAHLISPHGPTGRLVLATYHVVSPPRSARSIKVHGGQTQGIARSGTVLVRRSRLEFGSQASSGASTPTAPQDLAADSSMLLTDAENQHTFETVTLKWYMTELHWKREAALLKHLKSPIFVMELLESYCIPTLQNRANAYPFVNAMGGCSRLLSDVGPVKTAQHARSILRSISAAVEWCHRHNVVHLNIQPGSFFLEEGIDPATEDASWKLWDFTCARFIGESIGSFGGGGGGLGLELPAAPVPQPPPNHLHPEGYPFLGQQQHEEQMDRIGGNPLPPVYTAPELLEAWRAGDTTFPAEATMDTWSLGCVYYEILNGGQPLFKTETEAWGMVGGWENPNGRLSPSYRVPYPPSPTGDAVSGELSVATDTSTPFERSKILDPSGSISHLLRDMMLANADERVSLQTIMERIY